MRLKKFMSFMLSLIMIISSCSISFAEDSTENNIFIDDEVASGGVIGNINGDVSLADIRADMPEAGADGFIIPLEKPLPEAGANGFIAEISEPDPNATVITTPEELANIKSGGNYVLGNDIDLSTYNGGVWIPINVGCMLDGQGHKIINLSIPESSNIKYAGLFGNINGRNENITIKNIGVEIKKENGIFGKRYAGGLVCEGDYSLNITIENSYSNGIINAVNDCGGLIGVAGGKIIIENSYSNDDITSNSGTSGGLVGFGGRSTIIENSYNNSNVTSNSSYGGGLIGYSNDPIIIKNSYNNGVISSKSTSGGLIGITYNTITIINSYNSGNIIDNNNDTGGLIGVGMDNIIIKNSYNSSNVNKGGIVGSDSSISNIYIENSYNNGNVTSTISCGGLIGNISNNITSSVESVITVRNSYNSGNVTSNYIGNSYSISIYSGGLIGYTNHHNITIENSYNNSNITSSSINNKSFNGGLVGYSNLNSIITIEDSYFYGKINATSKNERIYKGGLVGSCGKLQINGKYYYADGDGICGNEWAKITYGAVTRLYRISDEEVTLNTNNSAILYVGSNKNFGVKWTTNSNAVKLSNETVKSGNSYQYSVKVSAVSPGEATITASCGAKSVSFKVTVNEADLYRISDEETTLNLTEEAVISASSKGKDGYKILWSRENPEIIDISEEKTSNNSSENVYSVKVKGLKPGTTKLTAIAISDDTGLPFTSVSFTIKVNDVLYAVSDEEIHIQEGEKVEILAGSKTDNPVSVNWKCSDYGVLQANSMTSNKESRQCVYKGTFTGLKAGKAVVNVEDKNKSKVTYTVYVGKLFPISKPETEIYDNKKITVFSAGSRTEEPLNVTWSSDSDSIEIISSDNAKSADSKGYIYRANIKGLKPGNANLTISEDSGKSVTFKVKVNSELKIYIDNYNKAVAEYEDFTLKRLEDLRKKAQSEEPMPSYEEMKPQIEKMFVAVNLTNDQKEEIMRAIYDKLLCGKVTDSLANINMEGNEIKDAIKITKAIMNNLHSENYKVSGEKYNVTISTVIGYNESVFAEIKIEDKKTGKLVKDKIPMTTNNTMDIMKDYVEQLNNLTEKSVTTAILSSIDFFGDALGINKYIKSSALKLINKAAPVLNSYDMNEIFRFVNDSNSVYNILTKIDTSDLQNSYNSVKALGDMALNTDSSGISDYLAKKTYNKVMEARNNLIKMAQSYVYGTPPPDTMLTTIIEKTTGKINIMCPVDVTVYDSENNELGSIKNNDVVCNSESISIDKNGDVKTVYILDNTDIHLKYSATDYGTLNISAEEYKDGVAVNRSNFYDIPLSINDNFSTDIKAKSEEDTREDIVIKSKDTVYIFDEYFNSGEDFDVNINAYSDKNGTVIGGGVYKKGDPVLLIANPSEGYKFIGWYDDENNLTETSNFYDFTAKEDINLKALFVKIEDIDYSGDELIIEKIIYGDVSNDGLLTANDASLLLQKVLDRSYQIPIEKAASKYLEHIDVDGNKVLTAADAAMILQKALHNDFVFPVEK